MRNLCVLVSSLVLILSLQSCKEDHLVEVEVTEPVVEEVVTMGDPANVNAEGKFQMYALPYAYDALEPHIDAKTMEVHYSKHHLGYTNNLNKAISGTDLENKSIEEILTSLDLENKTLRNNAGGFYNHNLYFELLSAAQSQPKGVLLDKINTDFGSVTELVNKLKEAGAKQFGSGWSWLVMDKNGKLLVGSTANQDNPLMPGMSISGKPIIGIDVWEHAYYLHYQNKRAEYLEAVFELINWDVVGQKYEEAISK
ncbi:MAG TPA: superoxide dismutase [Flavobacterium sp.]|nr:superoxide dismutase [Flavobacterium sp.]